ncbi:alpha/beta hydrolase, partial [Nocardia sp. NPDC019302]|uniref:alpha/beta hydrolase n=1 Tax=Nocardia sp. NPDC019302 TaxID=3154592 RepID=UPI0033CA6A31
MYPDLIGNTDGVRYRVRDYANRRSITRQLERLRKRTRTEERRNRALTTAEKIQLRNLESTRDQLADIERYVQEFGAPPVFLIAYAPQKYKGNGRVVVSIGDADTATNVTRHVGGFGTTLRSLSYRSKFAGAQYEVASRYAPDESQAAIIDIGYHHPTKLVKGGEPVFPLDPMQTRFAEVGGYVVARDTVSYNATREALAAQLGIELPSRRTLIGHSYGTTTVCYAGRDGRLAKEIDQVILTASPGAGPMTSAKEFGIGAANVYALTSEGDPIAKLGAHTHGRRGRYLNRGLGIDPANEIWGAVRIAAEPPDTPAFKSGMQIHQGYNSFVDIEDRIPTTALNNIGLITSGLAAAATREKHRPAMDRPNLREQSDTPTDPRQRRLRAATGVFTPEQIAQIEEVIARLLALRDADGNQPYAYLEDMPLPKPGEPFGADWVSHRHEWFQALLTGNLA